MSVVQNSRDAGLSCFTILCFLFEGKQGKVQGWTEFQNLNKTECPFKYCTYCTCDHFFVLNKKNPTFCVTKFMYTMLVLLQVNLNYILISGSFCQRV